MIVELANAMPLDLPFVAYDHESPSHPLNAIKLVKQITTYRVSLDCHGLLHGNKTQGLRSPSSIRR